MTDISGSRTFAAPIEKVVAMLRDESYTTTKYEQAGGEQVKIERIDATDDSLTVVSTRVVTVDLPGFAKKVLKPTNTMRQTDEWTRAADGTWRGTFTVEVQGAPVRMHGTMRLDPVAGAGDGGGATTETVDIHIEVKVPLVGGKIADWVGKDEAKKQLDGELAFNDAWLADH